MRRRPTVIYFNLVYQAGLQIAQQPKDNQQNHDGSKDSAASITPPTTGGYYAQHQQN